MIRFTSIQRVQVRKAKKRRPWKRTRNYKRLTALSNTMAGSVRIDFLNGIKKFKSKIEPQKIYEAWLSKDWNKVYSLLPWHQLPDDLEKLGGSLEKGFKRGTDYVVESLPPPVSDNLRFDTKNPRIRDYVQNRTGKLVVGIQDDTRSFISNAISRSFDEALTPRRVADIIKPSIGLYPKQTAALLRYKTNLEKQPGAMPDKVAEMVDKYHDRLLDSRAIMIARTESRLATNQGQLAVWDQASNQGLLDRSTAKKRWIVDGNPCPVCDDMEGEEVGLDETWTITYEDGSTAEVMVPTESHPNCMCGMELVFGESQDKLEESDAE